MTSLLLGAPRSSRWCDDYFREMGEFAIPRHFSFRGLGHSARSLNAYRGVRWVDLDSAGLRRILHLLFLGLDVDFFDGSSPFRKRMENRQTYIEHMVHVQKGTLSWSQIKEGFTIQKINELLSSEREISRAEKLTELIRSMHLLEQDNIEIVAPDFLRPGHDKALYQELCTYSLRHTNTVVLGLRGAARLGGVKRMVRALADLLEVMEQHPMLSADVFGSLMRSGIDRNLFWKAIPPCVRVRWLEDELGM